MLYLERRPHPALAPFVKLFWYARDPHAIHRHERVLPSGHAQVVISLARDYLTDANNLLDPLAHSSAALFLGIYVQHQQIDVIDLTELIGILFHPHEERGLVSWREDRLASLSPPPATPWL
jgi:hypothetical protein